MTFSDLKKSAIDKTIDFISFSLGGIFFLISLHWASDVMGIILYTLIPLASTFMLCVLLDFISDKFRETEAPNIFSDLADNIFSGSIMFFGFVFFVIFYIGLYNFLYENYRFIAVLLIALTIAAVLTYIWLIRYDSFHNDRTEVLILRGLEKEIDKVKNECYKEKVEIKARESDLEIELKSLEVELYKLKLEEIKLNQPEEEKNKEDEEEYILSAKLFLQSIEEETEEIKFSDEKFVKKCNGLINKIDLWLEDNVYG